jgi:predicted acyltransferase
MKVEGLSFYKRILITQLLSILFAVISNFHTRILINRDWIFDNPTLSLQIILLIIIFAVIIIRYLDGRWISVVIGSIIGTYIKKRRLSLINKSQSSHIVK